MLSNSNSLPSCASVLPAPGSTQLTQIHEAEDRKNTLDENRSLSSTESLRQLSEQLNGLVAQVQPHFGPSVLMIFWGSDVNL